MITIEHRQKANRIADAHAKDHTRSVEFMNGMRATLAWRIAGKPKGELDAPPYKHGTCQMESWKAGNMAAHDMTEEELERLSN